MKRIAVDRNGGRSWQVCASLLGALMLLAGTALVSTVAVAQITGTKHNLGSGGTGPNRFSGTTEICVFCHTPHGADTSAVAPLWNRTFVTAAGTYQTYDSLGTSTTLDGKTMPVGSVSIACLSCHDGAQAMNTVLNAPGSGSTNAAWTAATSVWTGTGTLNSGAAALGTDLQNDHPIGIQYCGGGYTIAAATGTCADLDFRALSAATIGGGRVFWVDNTAGGTAGSRDKTDMILYNRSGAYRTIDGGTTTAVQPFVECASCHDPHTANATFLRKSNASSAVCLACHVK